MPIDLPQIPPFAEAVARLDSDFIAVSQGAQGFKNEIDELKEKVLACVKVADPALYTRYVKVASEIERMDALYEDILKAAQDYLET